VSDDGQPQGQKYRLDLQYIGTPFLGWQSQPQGGTIQDHLEGALTTMLRHKVRITGAGRTDTGVHAEHQVASFTTTVPYAERSWIKSLHGLLPREIGVTRLSPVDESFHPILSAQGKAYRYRVWTGVTRNPWVDPCSWQVVPTLDLAAMRSAAQSLVGTYDFTSFCAVDSSAKTRERTVLRVSIESYGPLLEFWVIGRGFLKQMVRTMVGTLVDIGLGKHQPAAIDTMLEARDRRAAGRTAPAQGLTLVRVFYEDDPTSFEIFAPPPSFAV
jgi:tRNA pseudouridine38-40 synthase